MQTAGCFDHLQVLVLQAFGISKVPLARLTSGSDGEPWNDCKECAVFFSAPTGVPARATFVGVPAIGQNATPRSERGDITNEIPDVSPNPEFIDLPDVDRNSHTL